jgi:tetratricopeptide (TPR) repeat protein
LTNLSPAGWALAVLLLSYLPLGALVIAMFVERWRLAYKHGLSVHPFRGIPGLPMPVKPAPLPGPTIQTARKLLRTGQVDEALAQLKQLVEGKTANADAMSILGVAYARKRNFSQAEEAFRAALDMRPESAAIHYNLSLVLHQRGKYMEASWEAQKCLDGGYPVPRSFLDRLATKVLVQDQQLVPG